MLAEQQFAQDGHHDQGMADRPEPGAGHHATAVQEIDRLFAAGWGAEL